MSSGRIRDFSKPNPDQGKPAVQVLSAVKNQGVTVSQEPQPIEVTVHEEVIQEGQDEIRQKVYDEEGIEIRIRAPLDPKSWEKVKRGNDE